MLDASQSKHKTFADWNRDFGIHLMFSTQIIWIRHILMMAMFEFQVATWIFFSNQNSDQKSQIERKDSISPSFGNSASVAWCNKSSCKSKRCITAAWCFLVVSGSVANSERSARVVRWRCDFTRFLRHMQPPNLRGGFSNQKIPCNIQPKKIFVPPCTEL